MGWEDYIYYQDNFITLLNGDAREILPLLPAESVQCCVTSPPYFGLRDYGTANWHGGNPDCDHKGEPFRTKENINVNTKSGGADIKNKENRQFFRDVCGKCGAVREDKQIGLESSPKEFISQLELIFSEVRRVLRRDGTLWMNLGDSYANDAKWGGSSGEKNYTSKLGGISREKRNTGFKPKDLMMIPHRTAIALQDDGWFVRQDIVWSKPHPMPESVKDRCTKAHEYIFLMSKSQSYFFDNYAIQEKANYDGRKAMTMNGSQKYQNGFAPSGTAPQSLAVKGHERWKIREGGEMMRNKRSVWNVSTKPYAEAHFATFPSEIPEYCIKAGTSEKGACLNCGAPLVRIVDKELVPTAKAAFNSVPDARDFTADKNDQGSNRMKDGHKPGWIYSSTTEGWQKTCACESSEIEPQIVLDPFGGAGTTAIVAKRLGRKCILIELNPDYCELIVKRIRDNSMPLFDS